MRSVRLGISLTARFALAPSFQRPSRRSSRTLFSGYVRSTPNAEIPRARVEARWTAVDPAERVTAKAMDPRVIIALTTALTTDQTAQTPEPLVAVELVVEKGMANLARVLAVVVARVEVPSAGLKNGQKTSEAPASVRTTTSTTSASRLAARTPTIAPSSDRMVLCAMPLPGPTSPRTAHFCD